MPERPSLLVGCPVWKRSWIIRPWMLCVEQACATAGLEPSYCFVIDRRDTATAEAITANAERSGRQVHFTWVDEENDRDDVREWNPARFRHMVWLRNELLAMVRQLEPDLFLSLDSDILLADEALSCMVSHIGAYAAVGSKCYLSHQGHDCPNYAMLVNADYLMRPDADRAMEVDVILAIKLMTPDAYAVDYAYHWQGEDAGWSKAVREKGFRLLWDGSVVSKHVMRREMLDEIDKRCGY